MDGYVKDGVFFYNTPKTVDYVKFYHKHEGCLFIVNKDFTPNMKRFTVFAYSTDRSYNKNLVNYFKANTDLYDRYILLNLNTGGVRVERCY